MQNRNSIKPSKTAKPRRTQAERRYQTKLTIMDASLGLLIEVGYAGFSASGVAARAGVSRGAQEHYYPKKNDLIAAATEFAMQQAIAHARETARASSDMSRIDQFLSSSQNFFFMPVFMAMTQILIAARMDPELAKIVYPIIREARRILDEIWMETLIDAGYSRERVREFIELTQYLLRGIFYASSWSPYDVNRDAVVRKWRMLAPMVLSLDFEDAGMAQSPWQET